ncbi:DUF1307 domain-containing protein [Ignatzschineria rhizosphaerae]|uniref:DUF1307 domain-containing protein n=1 Tax=Ignatzschineria rhizosphaerae TaxID=2923279 RepID=A0ABY3X522_9GAMM|nr:DUF1307 domain-containing protein [Ignatzschineria rhizosphaerae]UNM96142.1 DUF1307 domain-containing protein [Ignatzschineria rhizosphaerae]
MNKIVKFGLGLFFAVAVAACGDDKTSVAVEQDVATYELNQPGVSIEMTLYGENDKVVKQTTNSTIEYSAIGAADAEQAKKILGELTNNTDYGALEGVTYSMEYGDTSAQESIIVDLTKADLKKLAELPGSAFDGDPSQGISFKATGTLLEQSGFTKVK